MMKTPNFACLILSYNRPNNVKTISSLRRQGYSGRIILVLDDTDITADEYKKNYPDCEIYIFSKKEAAEYTDTGDNTGNMKSVIFARNMCFKIAKEKELDFFLELDDDYVGYRYTTGKNNIFHRSTIQNLDRVFDIFLDYLASTPTQTIAFAQGGDFIGGHGSMFGDILFKRKAMNSFFCKTDRPFSFLGLMNDDVNMYVMAGLWGNLCFTASHVQLDQTQTQASGGGLTDIYLELGTYMKSFYSVMFHPSSVVVKDMGTASRRLHHKIDSGLTYPKIIKESYKKKESHKSDT
jgi:hypothetical protein